MTHDSHTPADSAGQSEGSVSSGPKRRVSRPVPPKRSGDAARKFVVLVSLLAGMFTSVGFTVPLRRPPDPVPSTESLEALVSQEESVRNHLAQVEDYESFVLKVVHDSRTLAVRSRLKAGDVTAAAQIAVQCSGGELWRKLSQMDAPVGLAGAKSDLVEGMILRKSALDALQNVRQRDIQLASGEADRLFAESDTYIRRALDEIEAAKREMRRDLHLR